MGSFDRYRKPPKLANVGDAVGNVLNGMVEGDPGQQGGQPGYDQYDPMGYGDPFMGGGLPPPDFYGSPKQQWNAEMMDRLICTDVPVGVDKNGDPVAKPKLWLFETNAFRHFQL